MEIAHLKLELARVTEERDILKKPPCTLPRIRGEVRLHSGLSPGVSCDSDVSSAPGEPERLLYLAGHPESLRTRINQALIARMRVLHQQTREAYGAMSALCRCASMRRQPSPIATTNSLPCRRRIACGRTI
jgi:hypothetical protein